MAGSEVEGEAVIGMSGEGTDGFGLREVSICAE